MNHYHNIIPLQIKFFTEYDPGNVNEVAVWNLLCLLCNLILCLLLLVLVLVERVIQEVELAVRVLFAR